MKNIINIINFVRQNEPREGRSIDLLDTTRRQIAEMRARNLTGTFLLQYDALIDPAFVGLFKDSEFELGLWMEIVQPQVEAIGEVWRGRYPWDWFNDVGFLIGYEPETRKRLIDEAMNKFLETFGYIPSSVGSWHMDACSMEYMSEKYRTDAFCICRDQIGTDGYTMQGGYYNQAYYPSRTSMFTPAGSPENQISTPVFRMLGSDAVYAYDYQVRWDDYRIATVPTLECISASCGGNPGWVEHYLNDTFSGSGICFQYTQAGQENSFGWQRMADAFVSQMDTIRSRVDAGQMELMTLGEAGRWYKQNFAMTPPAAYTSMGDYHFGRYKSVWYSCKNYRINLFWDRGVVRIRDMYIFSDRIRERYLTRRCTTHACEYRNLPVMDGALYGRDSGVYLSRGEEDIVWEQMDYRETEDGCVIGLRNGSGMAEITLTPEGISAVSNIAGFELRTEFSRAAAEGLIGGAEDTFANHNNRSTVLSYVSRATVSPKRVSFSFYSVQYGLTAEKGLITDTLCVLPENGRIELMVNG